MTGKPESRGSTTERPPLIASPRPGVIEVGGARMSLIDIQGGFLGIRTALQRQMGICEKCVMREAGREAGRSFLSSAHGGSHVEIGEKGFHQALAAYSEAGFGDFRISSIDWSGPLVSIEGREAFEGWAFAQRGQLQAGPSCDFTSGVIEGMLVELLRLEGRTGVHVTCSERRCLGAGAYECDFLAGSWAAFSELAASVPVHRHELPAAGQPRGTEPLTALGLPVICEVVDRNQALELQIAGLSDRVSDYERLLANILMNSADAIMSIDTQRRLLTWNRGAEQMYGYRAEEIVGKSFELLVPAERLETGEVDTIDYLLAEQNSMTDFETERLTKDGRRLAVEISCTLVRDSRGRVIGRSAIHRDITEKKRLERELLHSEKLSTIGKMSAHVAHEIRNPLSSIRLNLELLGDELESGAEADIEERRELLKAMQSEVEVLTRFTEEYLQFSRLPQLQRETVDLTELLEEFTAFVAEEAERRGPELGG
jgi:PAS domain S-box-containing protein